MATRRSETAQKLKTLREELEWAKLQRMRADLPTAALQLADIAIAALTDQIEVETLRMEQLDRFFSVTDITPEYTQ